MPNTIPVLGKALRLIRVLAETESSPGKQELSRQLSLSPSTCYRILQTLISHDWLRVEPSGQFAFSTGILSLLKPLSDYQKLFSHLRPPLETLVEQTGLTAKVSLRQGDDAVTVYRVESPRGLSPNSKIGSSFPLAYGSSGACLLSGLEDSEIERILSQSPEAVWHLQSADDVWDRIRQVRKSGYCCDPGHFQASVYGLSSPLLLGDKTVFAALTVVGWKEDFIKEKMARTQKAIRECARAVSEKLCPNDSSSSL